MKKFVLILGLFLSLLADAQQVDEFVKNLRRPNPPTLVNDYADVLTPEQEHALENKLVAYDDSTSTQIAVITIKSSQDLPIEEIALGILRSWGVGGSQNNNGIVIVASIEDRKIRIETGYGMEGAVPDITANTIIQTDIVPNFRSEDYYRGFDEATNSVFRAAAGEYEAPAGYGDRGRKGKGVGFGKILVGFVILWVILGIFGGGRGGRGGGFVSRRGYRGFGGPVIFPGSFGSGWGSGGGGGWSGGGGGGFGGFGGGGGGGGGASGSW